MSRLFLKWVKEIYIIACYRPPGGQIEEFILALETALLNLSNHLNIEIVLLGDMNINLNKPNDPGVRKYKDFLKCNGLCNLINYDTHFSPNNVGSRIDHILTTDVDIYTQYGICPLEISDHYLVYCVRKKFKVKHNKVRMWARKYKNLDEAKLWDDIENFDWTEVTSNQTPSDSWDIFITLFNQILDKYAPSKKMWFNEEMLAWVTREYLSLCKERDRLKRCLLSCN